MPVTLAVTASGANERACGEAAAAECAMSEDELAVVAHRLDGSTERVSIPPEALGRLHLFCLLTNLPAVSFAYNDDVGRVVVLDEGEFSRFSERLRNSGEEHVFETNDDDEEASGDSFDHAEVSAIREEEMMPHQFIVKRLLGKGASGECHLALNKESGDMVAIKIIEWGEEEFMRKQLKRELEALRKCEPSPNIVRLLGDFQDGPMKALVFEFMDGGSLERYGILPPRVLSVVACSLFHALIFLKNRKILHRDIKRANVLVALSGEVKLCDLGMSRILPAGISVANSYCGDSYYMPPERTLGLQYRNPSEIWCWAVLLAECSIGRHPFLQENEHLPVDFMKVVERCKKGAALTHLIPPEYGSDFVDMISANTQCDPSSRWDLVRISQSSYMLESATVAVAEAGDWFAAQQIHDG